jgi:hypothetical protein
MPVRTASRRAPRRPHLSASGGISLQYPRGASTSETSGEGANRMVIPPTGRLITVGAAR